MFPIPVNETARLAAMAEVDVAACDVEALDALASLARSVFAVPVAVVTLIGADAAQILAPADLAHHVQRRQDMPCCHTIVGSGPLVVSDMAADARFRDMPTVMDHPHFRFYAGVPLSRSGSLHFGTFCVFDFVPRELSPEQTAQLRDFARTATSLLRLREANRTLAAAGVVHRRAATTDALTGCLNRAGLREEMENIVGRSSSSPAHLAAIYVDLDHFKTVNDTFGHLAGDAVLRETADRLGAACRPGDLVGRIGGDEFCVVLANVDGVEALESVAARIVEACREPVLHEGVPVPCSVSLGAALAPVGPGSRDSIVKRADEALYRAKAGGRDGYALAS